MDNTLWMNYEAVQKDSELSASHFPLWPHDQSEIWQDNFSGAPLMQEGFCSNICHQTQDPLQGEFSMLLDGFNSDDTIMEASMISEEDMKIVQQTTKEESTMTNKRARKEQVLTFEEVSQYFYMPIVQVARELNIGLTLLKKKCRELGIARWPHRKMKSMQTVIKNVQKESRIMEASMISEEDMKIVQQTTKEESTVTNKRAREERVLTFEEVSQYFYMPIVQAAGELNIGLKLLKKKCRELGIARWPHRKMKSMQTVIKNVQGYILKEGSVGDLEQEQKLMEMKPSIQMQEKTKRIRQACFKANYKKRKLVAVKEET